jgi:16S rRNA (uracil1498-N3)-methyltransferase
MKTAPWLLAPLEGIEVGQAVVLDPEEARHLSGALRRRIGDEVVLIDGNGRVVEGRILAIGRSRVEAKVISFHRQPSPRLPGVTVGMAIISSRNMDWAVQKAVEIGVQRFIPVETERAQIRGASAETRIDHWRKISLQALKQCRRVWGMEVGDVVALPDLVENTESAGVVADCNGSAIDQLPEGVGSLLLVGPEGGFAPSERELLECCGWPRLRLGPHVLRAETAAVVGGAMLVARSENSRVESSEL